MCGSSNQQLTDNRARRIVQLRPWPPHFKELGGIASCPLSSLSVRYFSARSHSVPGYDDGEGLKLALPLIQSAFSPLLSAAWLKIAVSIAPAAAMRSALTMWVIGRPSVILDWGANCLWDSGSTAISFHGEHASRWLLLCEAEGHYWTPESLDPPSGDLAFPE